VPTACAPTRRLLSNALSLTPRRPLRMLAPRRRRGPQQQKLARQLLPNMRASSSQLLQLQPPRWRQRSRLRRRRQLLRVLNPPLRAVRQALCGLRFLRRARTRNAVGLR
jgi:hypothetical protein